MKKTMLFAIDKLGVTEENLRKNYSMDDFMKKLRSVNASFGIRTLSNGMDRIEITCSRRPVNLFIKDFEEKLNHIIVKYVESADWIAWKLH